MQKYDDRIERLPIIGGGGKYSARIIYDKNIQLSPLAAGNRKRRGELLKEIEDHNISLRVVETGIAEMKHNLKRLDQEYILNYSPELGEKVNTLKEAIRNEERRAAELRQGPIQTKERGVAFLDAEYPKLYSESIEATCEIFKKNAQAEFEPILKATENLFEVLNKFASAGASYNAVLDRIPNNYKGTISFENIIKRAESDIQTLLRKIQLHI